MSERKQDDLNSELAARAKLARTAPKFIKTHVTLEIYINPEDFDSQGDMEWAMIKEIRRKIESNEWDVVDDWPMHYVVYFPNETVTSLD